MTDKKKIWQRAVAIVLVLMAGAWFLGTALKLTGSTLWTLRIGLWLLILIGAAVVLWYLLHEPAAAAAGAPRSDDIDATMNAARAQLAAAAKSSMAQLPLVVLLGPDGSAKTTSVLRSGLEPELLAGGVSRDETVAPTKGVNVWYARDTVFVEAGGPLTADPARFARVVRHVQPRRVGAVFGGGSQAPRLALVCVSCEEFTRPGAAESVMATARALRDRLADLAKGLGIRLPVYVVFTKADRVGYFADYVRNFSADEARQVLGVTLPADAGAAGLYADRQTKRLGDAFQRIFQSLAEKRLLFLGRETAPEPKPGAYEFPRELRKMFPLATQVLVELCRPSQLQVSPFLRGVYFTGVRPVFVTDAAPAAAAQIQAGRGPGAGSATQVFGAERAAAQARAAAAAPVTRKVPQWVFLGRLFSDVLLADQAAMNVTRGGARVNLLRRVALGVAAAIGLIIVAGLGISFAGNRGLQHGTEASARAVASLPAIGASGPTLESIETLDTLRADVQQLREYQQNGAPLGLRWGLYSGNALLPDARHVYFASFDKQLFADTRAGLTARLAAVPAVPRPTDHYDSTYRVLKAYLITTLNPERSSEDFLAPVLLDVWSGVRQPDSARALVAQRQFAFYANELRIADPFAYPADTTLVSRGRTFLRQFKGSEPIYQAMLAEANAASPPIQFNRQVQGSSAFVIERAMVPGAFTKGGYATMQKAFGSADRFFQGERWVLGDEPPSQVDKTNVLAELRNRYRADYIAAWRDYLQGASVVRYGSVKDAATKLGQLSGPQSTLLQLIAIASQNTNVDTAIGNAMQPTHVVVPPAQTDKLIGQSVQQYMAALANLQGALDQVASAPAGAAEGPIGTATQNAAAARLEVQKLAQTFVVGQDGSIAASVQRLLTDPLASIDPFLRNYGAGQLNGKGGGFCAQHGQLFTKVPFNPRSPVVATVDEVAAVFKPVTGALWTYYNDALQTVIVAQGATFGPKPGGTTTVNPAFLSFFNRAAQFSNAIYPQGAQEPHLTLTLKPVLMPGNGTLEVTIDGETVEYSAQMRPHTFTWHGSGTGEATIAVRTATGSADVASFHGPWALFQLFDAAANWDASGTGYRAEWNLPGNATAKVGFDVELGNNIPPVLKKGFFAGFGCVGRVVQ